MALIGIRRISKVSSQENVPRIMEPWICVMNGDDCMRLDLLRSCRIRYHEHIFARCERANDNRRWTVAVKFLKMEAVSLGPQRFPLQGHSPLASSPARISDTQRSLQDHFALALILLIPSILDILVYLYPKTGHRMSFFPNSQSSDL